jgi:hypothetical protein
MARSPVVFAAAILWVACTSSSSPSSNTTSSGGTSDAGGTSGDAGPAGAHVVGAQGGNITVSDNASLKGTSILIPSGALTADVPITIAAATVPVTTGTEKAAGPVVEFGPPGTKFLKAVIITLPYELPANAAVSDLRVVAIESAGGRKEIGPDSAASGIVQFQADSFTRFGAVVPGSGGGGCVIPADCQLGQSCIAGQCVAGP